MFISTDFTQILRGRQSIRVTKRNHQSKGRHKLGIARIRRRYQTQPIHHFLSRGSNGARSRCQKNGTPPFRFFRGNPDVDSLITLEYSGICLLTLPILFGKSPLFLFDDPGTGRGVGSVMSRLPKKKRKERRYGQGYQHKISPRVD